MAKNYMKEVANLLGVELEEEFYIKECIGTYQFTYDGLYYRLDNYNWRRSHHLEDLLAGKETLIKDILTKQEKEYLSAVIRPFRDRVNYIKKKLGANYNYLMMSTKLDDDNNEYSPMPSFKSRTMYAGMELEKEYTLEELGI
jgi:hypothetical protein